MSKLKLFELLILLSLSAVAIAHLGDNEDNNNQTQCDDDWQKEAGRCYKVFSTAVTFHVAQKTCAAHGAKLAILANDNWRDTMKNVIRTVPLLAKNTTYWIGLGRLCPQANITWLDGSSALVTINNLQSFATDRIICVSLKRTITQSGDSSSEIETYSFEATACYNHRAFVCEASVQEFNSDSMNIDVETSPYSAEYQSDSPDASDCGDGSAFEWCVFKDRFKDYCYRVDADQKRSWSEAEYECQQDANAHLASIHDDAENSFVTDMVNFYSMSREDNRYWIGLHNAGNAQGIRWTDLSAQGYSNWSSHVNDSNYDNKPDMPFCAAIMSNRTYRPSEDTGKWLDLSCRITNKLKFVCKKPLNPGVTDAIDNQVEVFCKPDWLPFGGKCYKVFGKKKGTGVTFSEAQANCNATEAALAQVVDIYEQMFVNAIISDVAGQFVWINGTTPLITYRYDMQFWSRRRPLVNYCQRLPKDGGYLGPQPAVDCSEKLAYVCKTDPTLNKIAPPSDNSSVCAGKPGIVYTDSTCFKFMTDSLTQDQAEAKCHEYFSGGHLVSVHNYEELQLVYSVAAETKMQQLWIGLQLSEDGSSFNWTDGWPVSYTLWADEQTSENFGEKRCVKMVLTTDDTDPTSIGAHWENEDCTNSLGFICKRTTLTAPVVNEKSECDPGWISAGDFCYKLTDENDLSGAASECRKNKAHLASFHSKEEIVELLNSQIFESSGGSDSYFIGLQTITIKRPHGKPNVYHHEWTDGSGFTFRHNFRNKTTGNILPMPPCTKMGKDGQWTPVLCGRGKNQKYPGLCQKLKGVKNYINGSENPTPVTTPIMEESTTTGSLTTGSLTTESVNGQVTSNEAITTQGFSGFNATTEIPPNHLSGTGSHHVSGVQLVFIIIVVLVLGGGGGFFVYRRYKRRQAISRVGQFSHFVNCDDDI